MTVNGSPIWAEIHSSNPKASVAFYSELFGWDASAPVDEFGGYVNFTLNGKNVAGLTPDTSDYWMLYLHVDDAATPAAAAGARDVDGPHPVADLGVMVVMTDPTGARVGAWQRGAHTGFEVSGVAGSPVWHELHTDDYAGALDFYSRAFEWNPEVLTDSPDFRMSTLGSGPAAVAGIYDAKTYLAGDGSRWQIYFGVSNPEASAAIIEKHGGRTLEPLHETPFGIMAAAIDPTGAHFTIIGV
jgi:uncharacterized protein